MITHLHISEADLLVQLKREWQQVSQQPLQILLLWQALQVLSSTTLVDESQQDEYHLDNRLNQEDPGLKSNNMSLLL